MEAHVSANHLYATQIKEYGNFLKDYDQKLAQLHLPTLSDGLVPSTVRLHYACGNEELSIARMIASNSIVGGKTNSSTAAGSNSSTMPLNKILSTFAQLCCEIDCLEQEGRTLVRQIYERTESFRNAERSEQHPPVLWIADNIDLMGTVQCQYERLRDVGVLLLRQIGAFFDEEASYGRGKRTKKNGLDGKGLPSLEVDYLFDYVGKLLRVTLELDHMLWKTSLKAHWRSFAQKLRQLRKITRTQKETYHDLLSVCGKFGYWIGDEGTPDITGVKRLLEALYKVKTRFDPVSSGEAFSDRFMKFLKRKLTTLASTTVRPPATANGMDLTQANDVIGVNVLLNFALYLFLPIEQRMLKNLFELNLKFPLIPLENNYAWLPDEFVQEHGHKLLRDYDASAAPISVSTPLSACFDYQKARDNYLSTIEKSATHAVLCQHAASWLVEAHAQLRNRPPTPGASQEAAGNFTLENLRIKCGLLLEGIRLVREMEYVLGTLYALYGRCATERTDRLIQYRRMVVEYLLSSPCRSVTVPCLQFIVQHQQHKIYTIVNNAKKKILREAKESKSTANGALWLEKLSVIDALEKCLHGPATPNRVGLARLTIALCHGSPPTSGTPLLPLADDAYRRVESLLARLATFIGWEDECNRIDVADRYTALLSAAAVRQQALSASVVPMSNRIEAFIRWDFHGKWHQIEPFDPFRDGAAGSGSDAMAGEQNHTQKLVFAFLRTRVTQEANGKWLCTRHSVAQHLSDVFYTLSTISPSEWRIYREMRAIVDRKYGIRLVEDQLPRTTAEDRRGPRGHGQDDDVLALMEDFETFIGSYGYDLHGQLFIERQQAVGAAGGGGGGSSGVVNVVKIEHIANSIKRHGPGIISTVVNYAFQFLRQKLFTFSHFLYDEQIHSRLAADAKKLATEAAVSTSTAGSNLSAGGASTASYTYERALAFNRRIRSLGLSDDGETYVDLFRKLICQIGNAMAFVRMLHAGALHECTGAAEFVSNPPMAAEAESDADSHPTLSQVKQSVQVWKRDMATVRTSWRLENEFFRLLLNAFDGFRRRRTNQPADGENASSPADSFAHLELFYLIIPPLTISYVEAMLKAKETIAKKDRHGTFLPTDDGFVMGLSYLLTLLNQTAAFNSLHWFKEVHTKYAREMAKLNQQTAGGGANPLQTASTEPADEKMLPTVSLTRKRLNAMQHEFDQLQYNLSSSKIFFK
ncbi:WASH complex subunit 4 [Anopheles stephensi]|uniref:WASH complex subunit 4 n=1 Tax=Anopheles stephensi TaxID=30069 RepID=UPI0016589640|nr:WASH complex subunit 4 [Anopheles stephensi]